MRFCSLYSGSKGNAAYVAFGETRLLIDAGLSAKALETALCAIDVEPQSLSAILITHEHIDHIGALSVFARRHGTSVYASWGTWNAMEQKLTGLAPAQRREFTPDEDFYIGDVNVMPFSIPHDAAMPVGYCLEAGGKKVSFTTDLGHTTANIIDKAAGSDILVLEANHDVDMLKNGAYPAQLKKRILGSKGHLSNDACAVALTKLLPAGLRHVYLGHLSQNNNVPELAYTAAADALRDAGAMPGKDVLLNLTSQDQMCAPLTL